MSRAAFFRARAGKSDANTADIIKGLVERNHGVISVKAADSYLTGKQEDGVSDLLVYPWALAPTTTPPLPLPAPVWLEVKTKKGKLRESQKEWKAQAAALGISVTTVRHLVEAIAVVEENK